MIPALLTSRSSSPVQFSAKPRTDSRSARSSRRTSTQPGTSGASPLATSRGARETGAPAGGAGGPPFGDVPDGEDDVRPRRRKRAGGGETQSAVGPGDDGGAPGL